MSERALSGGEIAEQHLIGESISYNEAHRLSFVGQASLFGDDVVQLQFDLSIGE